ncbi:hypothetical protein [Streptomyces sp. TS71-3]|uniref:hypothetical protein n=1 Tax=Streptomyces sp. TS71-3 TaxID=2733862 RepID=UPI001B211BA0|nr:hypothetical protein [Streptomyces sp. TS71-3]GHJ39400.1 hypothetical protein Sm713_50090 [Streptomyces sp. TS71-3]
MRAEEVAGAPTRSWAIRPELLGSMRQMAGVDQFVVTGRAAAAEEGTLPFLEAGERVRYDIEFTFTA